MLAKVAIFTVLVAIVAAAPASQQPETKLLRYENEQVDNGGYRFVFESDDGSKREEEGSIVDKGLESPVLVVRGSFSFVGNDGITYTVDYIADENGFQPQGAHVPQAAPVEAKQAGANLAFLKQ